MKIKTYFSSLVGHCPKLILSTLLLAWLGSMAVGVLLLPDTAEAQGSLQGVLHRHEPRVQAAIGVQNRYTSWLMSNPEVLGTGVGVGVDGQPVIKVFTAKPGAQGIPEWLEFVPVQVEVTGMVFASGDTTAKYRPAPIGVSTGHPAITAGTIGARVKDATGKVFALSNNHVYANQNDASIEDNVIQPGSYDGGIDPDDEIGTLYAFEPIDFTFSGVNYIDAAIALSSTDKLGNSTLPDGYGTPSSVTKDAFIGLAVQKYGRTTGMTYGQVEEINVFVEVCYEALYLPPPFDIYFCIKSAYFFDQIGISPGGFSDGGDSGSLIVTDDLNRNPVGLLFAGGSTRTFANPIDLVLSRFDVSIDDAVGSTAPAAPTDLKATAMSSSQVDLAWTDNSVTELGFKIERCTDSCSAGFMEIGTVGANATSYSDTGLMALTTYTYRVHAYSADGDSAYSNSESATTLAVKELPSAPSNLIAKALSGTQIMLTWMDNATNETGFEIERCEGTKCADFELLEAIGQNIRGYIDSEVNKRTTYRYRIRAYNSESSVYSAYSNIASAKAR